MTLTQDQVQRYSRHLLMPEIGGQGQARLLESAVLIAFSPEARGAAEALAAYLAAAGVGRIGWWAAGAGEAPAPGSLAGLLDAYAPGGAGASVRSINPDARLETIGSRDEAKRRDDGLVLLLGEDARLEAFGRECRDGGKAVLRGRLSGMAGAVLAGEASALGFEPAEAGEELPPAPAEGALGALLAAGAIRALLGEAPAEAGFDFEKGRLWGRPVPQRAARGAAPAAEAFSQ
ncbi:MAG: hypothetical protein HYZ11_14930 [Candidatus Tectomicrobia bacterium]|uniref:Uncharacterized protein n=1 Tax=Tectimicrobiota bacterium TaxID=2528274 RepID=A0A932I2H9_UNCTE|nr:hypothetical protein [Candidatus Tectomicrobia bacterium]